MTVWGKVFCDCAVVSLSTIKLCSNECICQAFILVLLWTCAVGPCLVPEEHNLCAGAVACILLWDGLAAGALAIGVPAVGAPTIGAPARSGMDVQLWWAAPALHCLHSWVQSASTFMYKYATHHHTSWLCWMALIYVMTMLCCAQYYCCLLRTVGMNLAVWLCYNITVLGVAQLCQAYIVCRVL